MKTFKEFIEESRIEEAKVKEIYRVYVYKRGKAGFMEHLMKDYTKDFPNAEKARKYAVSWANSGTSPLIKKNVGGDIWTDVKFSK